MKILALFFSILIFVSVSCKSAAPQPKTGIKESAEKRVSEEKRKRGEAMPDYTVDWRKIADLAGKTEYDPYVTNVLWKRLNWCKCITGEAATELVADWEREFKWDKARKDWEAKRKPSSSDKGENSEE